MSGPSAQTICSGRVIYNTMRHCCVRNFSLHIAVNSSVYLIQEVSKIGPAQADLCKLFCRPEQAHKVCCCHLHDSYECRDMKQPNIFLGIHGVYRIQCTFECTDFKALWAACCLHACDRHDHPAGIHILRLKSSCGEHPLMCTCCHTSTGPLCPRCLKKGGVRDWLHSMLSADKASLKHCLIYASI